MSKEGWKPGHFIKKGVEKVKDAKAGFAEAEPTTKADDEVTFEPVSMAAEPAAAQASGDGGGAASFAEVHGDEDVVPHTDGLLSHMDMFFGSQAAPFYLNIVVVDSSAAVASQVIGMGAGTVGGVARPGGVFGSF